MRIRNALTFGAAFAVLAVAAAGCGGGGSSSSKTPPPAPGERAATVGVETTDLGPILVDSQGMTLYMFAKDSGTTSTCTGSCATYWPPLEASGKPPRAPVPRPR